jgi:hypothetical protein
MPRLRRWARKLALVLLELAVVLTAVPVVYNVATTGRVKAARALYGGPFVHVDGKLVAYRRWGAHGTPVILLGGFIVPSSVWDGVGRRLARDHRVFAIDLPPFGSRSAKGLTRWAVGSTSCAPSSDPAPGTCRCSPRPTRLQRASTRLRDPGSGAERM